MKTKIIQGVKCRVLKIGETIKKGDRLKSGIFAVVNIGNKENFGVDSGFAFYRPLKTPSKKKPKTKVKSVEVWMNRDFFNPMIFSFVRFWKAYSKPKKGYVQVLITLAPTKRGKK